MWGPIFFVLYSSLFLSALGNFGTDNRVYDCACGLFIAGGKKQTFQNIWFFNSGVAWIFAIL